MVKRPRRDAGIGSVPNNEPVSIALMPSRRKQIPDEAARVERSYRKMMMYGYRGGSLAIHREIVPRAPPEGRAARGTRVVLLRVIIESDMRVALILRYRPI